MLGMFTTISKSKNCHQVLNLQEGDLSLGRAARGARGGHRSQEFPAILQHFAAALLLSWLMDTHMMTQM